MNADTEYFLGDMVSTRKVLIEAQEQARKGADIIVHDGHRPGEECSEDCIHFEQQSLEV